MIEERRHKLFGTPMSEVIALTPSELSDDIGVGLGGIVWHGRHGFGL